MQGIYKITSPSNKVYIGQSINIENRFKCYKRLDCKSQIKLYRSFVKHGVENHKFEIVTLCYEEQLNEFERDFQEAYDVLNGLNCRLTETNDKSGKLSEETKKRISINHSKHFKNKKHTEESKLKNRLMHLNKKHNTDTCLKISENTKGKKHHASKKVICIETGKIWDCISDCAKELNMNIKTLSRYVNGDRKNKTSIIYLKDYEKK